MKFAPSVVLIDVDCGLDALELARVAAALQKQVLNDFAPFWNTACTVRSATPAEPARIDEIEIQFLKVPTQDGALGFHDRKPDGTPIAYVFPELMEAGQHWSSCASHELLELLGDPLLHLCVELDNGEIWDRENCDRVEMDSYEIDGVTVSNFNTPECFEPPADLTGVKFDFMGLSKVPNEVRDGGYAQKYDLTKGWTMVGQMRAYRAAVAKMGMSRGARRRARRS